MNRIHFMAAVPEGTKDGMTITYSQTYCEICGGEATVRVAQNQQGTGYSTQCHNEECDHFRYDFVPNVN